MRVIQRELEKAKKGVYDETKNLELLQTIYRVYKANYSSSAAKVPLEYRKVFVQAYGIAMHVDTSKGDINQLCDEFEAKVKLRWPELVEKKEKAKPTLVPPTEDLQE